MDRERNSLYFFIVNSELKKNGSVGMRAEKIINFLTKKKFNKIVVISRDKKYLDKNIQHYSYFYFSFFLKFLKFLRIFINKNISDRYFESIFLDFYSSYVLSKITENYSSKKIISFEFTPGLVKKAKKRNFDFIQDIQIMPIRYSLELSKKGIIKNIPKSFFYKKLKDREDFILENSTRIVCPSSFIEKKLSFYTRNKNLDVCYFGVDLKKFKSLKNDNLIKKNIKVGFLGQISERKGLRYLLEAFMDNNFKDDELFIGGSIQKANVDFEIKNFKRNNINFLGNVNPVEFFKNIDILVHPSLIEGSAKVIYEAMASGVIPIVTPNTGSIVENGKDGLIINICDSEDIKEKLSFLKENMPNQDFKDNIKKKIYEFSWNSYAIKYLNLISQRND